MATRQYHVRRIAELKLMIENTRCSDPKDKQLRHRRHFVRQYKEAIAKHERAISNLDQAHSIA